MEDLADLKSDDGGLCGMFLCLPSIEGSYLDVIISKAGLKDKKKGKRFEEDSALCTLLYYL